MITEWRLSFLPPDDLRGKPPILLAELLNTRTGEVLMAYECMFTEWSERYA